MKTKSRRIKTTRRDAEHAVRSAMAKLLLFRSFRRSIKCRAGCRHPARQEPRGSAEGAQSLHLLALSAVRKALSRKTRAEQGGPSLLCRSALALPTPLPAVLRCTLRAPASHTHEKGLMHPLKAAGERVQGKLRRRSGACGEGRWVTAEHYAPDAGRCASRSRP